MLIEITLIRGDKILTDGALLFGNNKFYIKSVMEEHCYEDSIKNLLMVRMVEEKSDEQLLNGIKDE